MKGVTRLSSKKLNEKATTLGVFEKLYFKLLKILKMDQFGDKISDCPSKISKLFGNFFQKSSKLANLRLERLIQNPRY